MAIRRRKRARILPLPRMELEKYYDILRAPNIPVRDKKIITVQVAKNLLSFAEAEILLNPALEAKLSKYIHRAFDRNHISEVVGTLPRGLNKYWDDIMKFIWNNKDKVLGGNAYVMRREDVELEISYIVANILIPALMAFFEDLGSGYGGRL